jgi:hypothetical protein
MCDYYYGIFRYLPLCVLLWLQFNPKKICGYILPVDSLDRDFYVAAVPITRYRLSRPLLLTCLIKYFDP